MEHNGDSEGKEDLKDENEGMETDEPAQQETKEGWLTPEELQEVKANIEAGIEYQKLDERWVKWGQYLDWLNCNWDGLYTSDEIDQDPSNVNSIFSNYQTQIPTLYFQQPEANVTAAKPSFEKIVKTKWDQTPVQMDNFYAAKLLQKRLNNVIKNIKIEEVIERFVGDPLAPYGYGCVKVGYGETTEASKDLKQQISKTTYWIRRVDPRNIVFDPIASSFRDRTWCAERICRSKKALKKNPLYLKEKIEGLSEKIPETLKKRLEKLNNKFDPKLIEFWEYHDEENQVIRWISIEGNPVEIRGPVKKEKWIEGSDYVFLSLNVPTDDSIYPTSDVEPIADQAKARNKIRTAQKKFFENVGTTVFYEEGAFKSDEAKEAWKTSGNGITLAPVSAGTISGQKIQVVPPPSIPRDWYSMDEIFKHDNDSTLGITDYQRGDPEKRTATEATFVNNAANVRVSYRRRKIKNAILEIVEKLAGLIVQYDDQKTMIDVSDLKDDDGFYQYLKEKYNFNADIPYLEVSKEDWQGEYLFDFDIEEMVERPKSLQIQQLSNTLTQIAQSPMLAQTFAENFDAEKTLAKLFELQGMMIESVTKDDKGQIPAEMENEMVEDGREIPPPHKKDNDDLHTLSHIKVMKDMMSKMPMLQRGAEAGDQRAVDSLQLVQNAIASLQQHILLHQQKKAKKLQAMQMGGAGVPGGGPAPMNGPSVQQQVTPPSPPQGPSQMQIAQNAGVNNA